MSTAGQDPADTVATGPAALARAWEFLASDAEVTPAEWPWPDLAAAACCAAGLARSLMVTLYKTSGMSDTEAEAQVARYIADQRALYGSLAAEPQPGPPDPA